VVPDPGVRGVGSGDVSSAKHLEAKEVAECSLWETPSLGFTEAADSRSASSSSCPINFEWFECAWGNRKPSVGEWSGSIHGDQRSFAAVVRFNTTSVVMVNPRPTWGWGQGNFGGGRGGRGDGRQQGMAWFHQGAAPCGGRGSNPQGGRGFVLNQGRSPPSPPPPPQPPLPP
jgi:hypothetical protein